MLCCGLESRHIRCQVDPMEKKFESCLANHSMDPRIELVGHVGLVADFGHVAGAVDSVAEAGVDSKLYLNVRRGRLVVVVVKV